MPKTQPKQFTRNRSRHLPRTSMVSTASPLRFLAVPTASAAHSSISPVYRSLELGAMARVSPAPHEASSHFIHRCLGEPLFPTVPVAVRPQNGSAHFPSFTWCA
jgi:hypothetical protein